MLNYCNFFLLEKYVKLSALFVTYLKIDMIKF